MPEISSPNFHCPFSVAKFSAKRTVGLYLVFIQFRVTSSFSLSFAACTIIPSQQSVAIKTITKPNLPTQIRRNARSFPNPPLAVFHCGFLIKQKNPRRVFVNEEKRMSDRNRMIMLALTIRFKRSYKMQWRSIYSLMFWCKNHQMIVFFSINHSHHWYWPLQNSNLVKTYLCMSVA